VQAPVVFQPAAHRFADRGNSRLQPRIVRAMSITVRIRLIVESQMRAGVLDRDKFKRHIFDPIKKGRTMAAYHIPSAYYPGDTVFPTDSKRPLDLATSRSTRRIV